MRALTEGPLHEAFLSPRKDQEPNHVAKAPPPPIEEKPAIDPPNDKAQWIEGYWEWDGGRNEYVWVTGTWRVSPPGRFWVNGYWKRDDRGWYRVPGFWSERKTDRLDYRKDGPPQERPDDEPGEPPSSDCFYIPGQYYPDGDGVVWKKGYWTKAYPGWAWVPAQWVRQPDGWVFQDGYWDRTLEDRGTLFAPAEVDKSAQPSENLTYQPYTTVPPEMYGKLNGAFGRPNSNYDGYPGVYYDDTGRYYGYASYGNLDGYYGYLDYPYYGGNGYPYYATPVQYGYGGYGGRLRRMGYGGYGGMGYGGWVTAVMAASWEVDSGSAWAIRTMAMVIRSTAAMAGTVDSAMAGSAGMAAMAVTVGYGGYGGFGYGGYGGFGLGFGYGRLRRVRARLRLRLSVLWLRLRFRLWWISHRLRLGGFGLWTGLLGPRLGESLCLRQSERLDQPERQHQSQRHDHAEWEYGNAEHQHHPEHEYQSLGQFLAWGAIASLFACVRESAFSEHEFDAHGQPVRDERGPGPSSVVGLVGLEWLAIFLQWSELAYGDRQPNGSSTSTASGARQGQGTAGTAGAGRGFAQNSAGGGNMGRGAGMSNSAMGRPGMGANAGRMGAAGSGMGAMGGHPGAMGGGAMASHPGMMNGMMGGHPGGMGGYGGGAARWAATAAVLRWRLPRRHGERLRRWMPMGGGFRGGGMGGHMGGGGGGHGGGGHR